MSETTTTVLVRNIGQLITMAGPVPRLGADLRELGLVRNGAVALSNEVVTAAGPCDEVERSISPAADCVVIDADGAVVTPGLIDPHTHPVFAKTREMEFEMRILGKSYMEIAEAGGGIRSSVRDLRTTPRDVIVEKSRKRLDRILAHGVTTIEAKSGYGLSTESEIMTLEIIRELNRSHPLDLIPTFLGAHEVPDEYRGRTDEYIDLINHEMLPRVVQGRLAEFSDIFTETGVFDIEQSRRVQQAAKDAGLGLKFHADELTPLGGAELAAEMGAVSADHLVYITDRGIRAMAESGTVAVLLPGTTFALGHTQYAPARRMIEEGVVVSLSTDCNPGSSYTENLSLIISIAALRMKMTAAEAISAVTVNAAVALNRGNRLGQLLPGRQADLVIWDMQDYREFPYHYGINPARVVIKRGKVAVNNQLTGVVH
ncbi:MAG: imidazolonepropionase [candidate division Zixibacteria bacterium]|jgi:imidazolonepropionase|nr:imidazolonepropionase [candidate division Zixibacteria bacterium]